MAREGKAIIDGKEEIVSIGPEHTPDNPISMESLMEPETPGLSGVAPPVAVEGWRTRAEEAQAAAEFKGIRLDVPALEGAGGIPEPTEEDQRVTKFLDEKGIEYKVEDDGTINYDPAKAELAEVTAEMIAEAGNNITVTGTVDGVAPPTETSPEAESEDTPAPEPEKPTYTGADVLEQLQSRIPGIAIDNPEAIPGYFIEVVERASVVEDLSAMIQDMPELGEYIRLVSGGSTPNAAASSAFSELAKMPDMDEDPKAYSDWTADQARIETERRLFKERGSEMDVRAKARKDRVETTLDGFITRHNAKYPDDPADRDKVLRGFNSLFHGDPAMDGKFRADAFDIYDRGVNFDKYLEIEVEKEVAKKMATLATVKPKTPEAIPSLGGAGGEVVSEAQIPYPEESRFSLALDKDMGDAWDTLLKH